MPSTFDDALDVTRRSLDLAHLPAIATLLSLSKVTQALEAGPGGGMTFPMPTGLPTLWTYVSLPSGSGGMSISGPLAFTAFIPLFIVGLVITSALEAGFLGTLRRRIEGRPVDFLASAKQFVWRMILVNLLRALVVFAMFPLIAIPPLAIVVVIAVTYLIYGLPFVIVVTDEDFETSLRTTIDQALSGGRYAGFGVAHLLGGAVLSLFLTTLVRNGGLFGILVGTAVVAVPAVFVGAFGLLLFRELVVEQGTPA